MRESTGMKWGLTTTKAFIATLDLKPRGTLMLVQWFPTHSSCFPWKHCSASHHILVSCSCVLLFLRYIIFIYNRLHALIVKHTHMYAHMHVLIYIMCARLRYAHTRSNSTDFVRLPLSRHAWRHFYPCKWEALCPERVTLSLCLLLSLQLCETWQKHFHGGLVGRSETHVMSAHERLRFLTVFTLHCHIASIPWRHCCKKP